MEALPGRINGVAYYRAPDDGWIHLAQCLGTKLMLDELINKRIIPHV